MEVGKVLERVIADDIRVENKEGAVILSENLLSKLQRTGSAQRLGLDGEGNLDIVLLLVLS